MTTVIYNVATDDETTVTPGNALVPQGERPVTIRSGNGAVSYQGGEVAEVGGYQSLNTNELASSGSLDVRTPWGSPRQGAVLPTDIIRLPSGETTVQVAERLGLVERDVHGRFVLVPDGEARVLANEQPQEAPQDEGEALSDARVESELAELASIITPGTQVAIAQQMIADGMINPNTLARAAGEGSLEPGALNERLSVVFEGFQAQADSTVKSLGGDDPQAFYEWAREHNPQALKRAMQDHVMERTTKGYQPLFSQYVETLADHSPDDVLSARLGDGITAHKIDGKVILDIEGHGRMTYRSAIKAGIIKVSGA
jgi:hypothetical protein